MAAFQVAKSAQGGTGFDGNFGAEDDIRFDHCVAAYICVVGEEDGFRRSHGDAVGQGFRPGLCLERRFCSRKLRTRVHAKRFGFVAADRSCLQTPVAGDRRDIGQIVLTRRVVVSDRVY